MQTVAKCIGGTIIALLLVRLAASAFVSYGAIFMFFVAVMAIVTTVGAYYFAKEVIAELERKSK